MTKPPETENLFYKVKIDGNRKKRIFKIKDYLSNIGGAKSNILYFTGDGKHKFTGDKKKNAIETLSLIDCDIANVTLSKNCGVNNIIIAYPTISTSINAFELVHVGADNANIESAMKQVIIEQVIAKNEGAIDLLDSFYSKMGNIAYFKKSKFKVPVTIRNGKAVDTGIIEGDGIAFNELIDKYNKIKTLQVK